MQRAHAIDVVLVGVVLPGVENHSLAVLGRALDEAGFAHAVVPFRGFAGMTDMIADVLRLQPTICGISLQTTEAALAALAFARLLRVHGYAGTIAVGGHLANLDPESILANGGVDVVVQLAGEAAIVGLARGEDPRSLPGTVTRDGRGLSPVPVRVQAMPRARLGEHLGFGAADLIISRGCPAHCGYCCVATVSDLSETAGSARHVVTDIDVIADEIADVTARGGRAFHFMDDNILPLDCDAALAWTHRLRAALAARHVPPIAFSLQLRADVVTPALADSLAELGLVRAYIGIDGYTSGQLRSIGRHAHASAGATAIDLLNACGVLCVANSLIVGPTIAFETLTREIEGLAAIRHAPVHLLPIEARPGTVYHRRATARGLIEGGPLWPVYRFEDDRTFLVGELITKLPTRLVERSVPIALYDLAWALGVARRLAPQVDVSAGMATYARVTEAWNADQIRVLREAVVAATHGREATAQLLAAQQAFVRVHDEALLRACDAALADVECALSRVHGRPVRAHARGRLLGGLAIAMGLASAACDSPSRPPPDAAVYVDAPPDAPPVCADEQRMPQDLNVVSYNCDCLPTGMGVQLTFNDRAEIVAVRDENGGMLPANVEQCFLDLVAGYCYPSYASTTQTISTCHNWIA